MYIMLLILFIFMLLCNVHNNYLCHKLGWFFFFIFNSILSSLFCAMNINYFKIKTKKSY